jgi:hypothetical protein
MQEYRYVFPEQEALFEAMDYVGSFEAYGDPASTTENH